MSRIKLFAIVLSLLAFMFLGFECSSTDLTSAKLYIKQKNYDKALEALQREVQKNPKSDEGYYLMGYVYGEQETYGKMMDAYNQSLQISNKYKDDITKQKQYYWAILFNRGVTFYQRGGKAANQDSSKVYYDKSIDAFQNAVKIEPDSADTYKNLAFVYMSLGENDQAIDPLKKLIDKENSLDGYKFLGEIYYNKGTNLKNHFESTKNVQDSVQAMENFNKAIDILQKGRKIFPDDSDMLLTLSNAYIAAGKAEVAMNAFKAGVEKDPNNQYYRYNYGVLLLGTNQYEKAIEQFQKALDIDPEYQNALYNISVAYVKWGAKINKDAEENGQEESNYKEKFQKALPNLEKLVQLNPDEASNWELIGKVYTVLGMQNDATNAFNKADELRKK